MAHLLEHTVFKGSPKHKREGVTAEEVKAAKSAMLQEKQVERSQDGMLASRWSQYLAKKEGRTFAYDADLIKKLADKAPAQSQPVSSVGGSKKD